MIFGKKQGKDGAEKPGAGSEGKSGPEAAQPSVAQGPRRASPAALRQARMAQSFAQVVAVLMRDPGFRSLRIADLEWLVLPPIMSGQFRLAHAATQQQGKAGTKPQTTSPLVPVAVALWAHVSPAIDKQLSENLDQPVALPTNAWASGKICWLVALAGDKRALPTFLKQLQEKEFKGQQVKYRARDANGKVVVKTLGG